ncbi:MAG: hypothetical protein OXT65_11635 [Alphaproteobacteria bacterium]|nr:hypothetical protein [Alphaproteobacteria bacterium]
MKKKKKEQMEKAELARREVFSSNLQQRLADIDGTKSLLEKYEKLDSLQNDITKEKSDVVQRFSVSHSSIPMTIAAVGFVGALIGVPLVCIPLGIGVAIGAPIQGAIAVCGGGSSFLASKVMQRKTEKIFKSDHAAWVGTLDNVLISVEGMKADIVDNRVNEMTKEKGVREFMIKFPSLSERFTDALLKQQEERAEMKVISLPKPGPKQKGPQ